MSRRTVQDVALWLEPRRAAESIDLFLPWPPDLFALTSKVLAESEAYVAAVSPSAGMRWNNRDKWQDSVLKLASEWSKTLGKLEIYPRPSSESHGESRTIEPWRVARPAVPHELRTLWEEFVSESTERDVLVLAGEMNWCQALITLHAVADETAAALNLGLGFDFSVGVREVPSITSDAHLLAEIRLSLVGTLSYFDESRCRVLPKYHTPQVGISLRSMSRHLAFVDAPVRVRWRSVDGQDPERPDIVRCLVLPWPLLTKTGDFRPVDSLPIDVDRGKFGMFEYAPVSPKDGRFKRELLAVVEAAIAEQGAIDMVVLPELSVTDEEAAILEQVCNDQKIPVFVCGARAPATKSELGKNEVVVGLRDPSSAEEFDLRKQPKHHRWCLTPSQVAQYQLGGVLHSGRAWWEATRIAPRELNFVDLHSDVLFCTLICEDLARQDPVAGVLRAVGPTLVIALLMDGPQLLARWPARYATVLAEDPGSAVLTVTSLGMAQRSVGPDGRTSRSIALWKDTSGHVQQIEVAVGASGVLLSLNSSPNVEFAADGRCSQPLGRPFGLRLAGVVQVFPPPGASAP